MSKVLVVDDSPSARSFLVNILQSAGYAVTPACDGQEALEMIEETNYDLLLTDLNMPKVNGYDFIQQAREREQYKQTPIAILSSGKDDKDKRRGYKAGANIYITKPCRPDTLLENVKILSTN